MAENGLKTVILAILGHEPRFVAEGGGCAGWEGIGCRPGLYPRRDRAGRAHAWAWQAATRARVAYNNSPGLSEAGYNGAKAASSRRTPN